MIVFGLLESSEGKKCIYGPEITQIIPNSRLPAPLGYQITLRGVKIGPKKITFEIWPCWVSLESFRTEKYNQGQENTLVTARCNLLTPLEGSNYPIE